MRELLGSVVLIMITIACFSQDSIKMKDADMQDSSMMSASKMKDCLLFKKGQVFEVKQGQKMKLERSMTLMNGTAVAPDGTVTMTNGKTKKLQEGEWIDMNGKMGSRKKNGNGAKDSDSTSIR